MSFKIKLKNKIFITTIILASIACVPLRKQMIFQDLKKKNVRQLYDTDTTLAMPKFKYYLQPKDIIQIKITSISKSEINLEKISEMGDGSSTGPSLSASSLVSTEKNGYIIDSLGNVTVPVLGKIKIGGATLEESRFIIQNIVNKYLDNVIVKVNMLNYYIYTYGEISLQGKIQSPSEELTLIEAIILAGGFKEYANREKIKLIRKLPNNKVHISYFSLLDQDIITKNDIYLMPNDIIIVEPLRSKNFRTYTLPNATLALSAFSLVFTLLFAFNSFRNIR